MRTLIPQSHQTRLGALDQQLLAALLTKETNQQELARQGVLLAQSEKLIEARLAEINGNPALANLAIPDVHITGLLTSIVEEEESRNAALLEADRLMRQLKRARDKFAEIRHDNERRVEGLPQPGPRPSPTVGSTGTTVGSNGR